MAGKTFPGIGDAEDELDPADAADSADHYSGPTVVDDVKVEQGLKKLRSLDAPPGPLTGIHQAVTDALLDSGRVTMHGTADLPTVRPPAPPASADGRETAIGRSVGEEVLSEQTSKPFDDRHLRGTMFGHSVHLPDLDLEARKKEIETSKALAVVERGQPTSNEIAIFQPGPYARQAGAAGAEAPYPFGRTPYPPQDRFRDTPIDLGSPSSRRRLMVRAGLAAVGIALVVG
ncbi:MAG TPA: hypothetical protein VHO06_17215, partial [Polyangia bacterium]|nr:hypothetical protein [Polyangia bacterium]